MCRGERLCRTCTQAAIENTFNNKERKNYDAVQTQRNKLWKELGAERFHESYELCRHCGGAIKRSALQDGGKLAPKAHRGRKNNTSIFSNPSRKGKKWNNDLVHLYGDLEGRNHGRPIPTRHVDFSLERKGDLVSGRGNKTRTRGRKMHWWVS